MSVERVVDSGAVKGPGRGLAARRRTAHLVWALVIAAYVVDVVFLYLNQPYVTDEVSWLVRAIEDLSFVIVATLGLVVLRSQPWNQVGWWMMMAGLSFPLEGASSELISYANQTGASSAVVAAATWVAGWSWLGAQLAIPFILLYYPDGRLPSRRWRPIAALFWTMTIYGFVIMAFAPWTDDELGVSNPLGVAALTPLMDATVGVFFISLRFVLPALGAASLIARFRNGGAVVKAQVKFAALLAVVSVLFFGGLELVEVGAVTDAVLNIVYTLFAAGTIGGAIMRYRLFDIDRLISRTISYVVVIAFLGAVYFGLVTSVTTVLGFDSSLAVAGTTLAVAALFNPVRKRVQAWVDRRFNRSRYDAEKILDGFSSRLRDELDVDRLTRDLVTSVTEAMQPSTASVWVARR